MALKVFEREFFLLILREKDAVIAALQARISELENGCWAEVGFRSTGVEESEMEFKYEHSQTTVESESSSGAAFAGTQQEESAGASDAVKRLLYGPLISPEHEQDPANWLDVLKAETDAVFHHIVNTGSISCPALFSTLRLRYQQAPHMATFVRRNKNGKPNKTELKLFMQHILGLLSTTQRDGMSVIQQGQLLRLVGPKDRTERSMEAEAGVRTATEAENCDAISWGSAQEATGNGPVVEAHQGDDCRVPSSRPDAAYTFPEHIMRTEADKIFNRVIELGTLTCSDMSLGLISRIVSKALYVPGLPVKSKGKKKKEMPEKIPFKAFVEDLRRRILATQRDGVRVVLDTKHPACRLVRCPALGVGPPGTAPASAAAAVDNLDNNAGDAAATAIAATIDADVDADASTNGFTADLALDVLYCSTCLCEICTLSELVFYTVADKSAAQPFMHLTVAPARVLALQSLLTLDDTHTSPSKRGEYRCACGSALASWSSPFWFLRDKKADHHFVLALEIKRVTLFGAPCDAPARAAGPGLGRRPRWMDLAGLPGYDGIPQVSFVNYSRELRMRATGTFLEASDEREEGQEKEGGRGGEEGEQPSMQERGGADDWNQADGGASGSVDEDGEEGRSEDDETGDGDDDSTLLCRDDYSAVIFDTPLHPAWYSL